MACNNNDLAYSPNTRCFTDKCSHHFDDFVVDVERPKLKDCVARNFHFADNSTKRVTRSPSSLVFYHSASHMQLGNEMDFVCFNPSKIFAELILINLTVVVTPD